MKGPALYWKRSPCTSKDTENFVPINAGLELTSTDPVILSPSVLYVPASAAIVRQSSAASASVAFGAAGDQLHPPAIRGVDKVTAGIIAIEFVHCLAFGFLCGIRHDPPHISTSESADHALVGAALITSAKNANAIL